MKKYAILIGDEDGNCFKPIDDLDAFLLDPSGEMGVELFRSEVHPDYPENWPTNEGVLISYEVVVPQEKTKEWTIE